jgi:hypothetical protein
MKRLITLALVLVMVFALGITAFAETTEATTDTSEVANEETTEQIVEETTSTISTILGISGTVGIGAIIITVIVFFLKNLKAIKTVVTSLANVFKSIFSKDGNVSNIHAEFKAVTGDIKELTSSLNAELVALKDELAKEKEESAQVKHILSVFIINSTYLNPYAKNELLKLICGEKEYGETVAETVQNVSVVVEESKNAEVKPETPYLDKVTAQ